jgi:hypothetical protein
MFNYEKMMKLAKDKNEVEERAKLVKEVQELRTIKEELRAKADKLGVPKDVAGSKNMKIATNITLDYVKLCYALEVTSEHNIIKLVLRGDITMMD